ncbi:MAG: type II 3-dehydroquinate dehydratase [Cytophagales bacterium]|nr:MAG: type II 3-dehydroquinate dehydratase [Cytophagales bacterium]TAF60187.1 MAG: type II 3-dehydroquinate dehydratase [Cytophagales bacterium]
MKPHILLLNGPNLNLLGKREPHLYGTISFESYLSGLVRLFPDFQLTYHQSNHEGQLIDWVQDYGFKVQGIVLNAGGFSHTSIALADALTAVTAPAIEVHISNVFARESYRHHSYLSAKCKGVIAGFGLEGYKFALLHFRQMLFPS